jgi:hypothetical protein
MATQKVVTVVMQTENYRKPDSFIYFAGDKWEDFLKRWNDPDITNDEAKGLLHAIADRLWWADTAPERIGEDSRETCVRFLLHYADQTFPFDNAWQIVEKARQVLIHKVLDTTYIRNAASDELVEDILTHLIGCITKDKNFYDQEPYRRKIEAFLRIVDGTRNGRKIRELVNTLITILFRSKHAYKELRRERL